METNQKSVSCEIGNRLGEEGLLNTYNNNNTELKLFKGCKNDITSHLKSSYIHSENVKNCPNATEQWLIQNHLKQNLLDNDMICLNHQMKYGVGWRS